jgi:hypothetical protein
MVRRACEDRNVSYRVTSLGLAVFGIVGMFSIGRPRL